MTNDIQKLESLLEGAIQSTQAPGLLFSGGVRSSLLAAVLGAHRGVAALSTAVPGASLDEPRIPPVAEALRLTVVWVRPDADTLLRLLPQTIRLLKTPDPRVLWPALTLHAALLMAQELHLTGVFTGEQGVSGRGMTLAERLGWGLGMAVHAPFSQTALRLWEEENAVGARTIMRDVLARHVTPAFFPEAPCPAGEGGGISALGAHLAKTISDKEFIQQAKMFEKEDGVSLPDRERLVCYRLYRSQFGPHKP